MNEIHFLFAHAIVNFVCQLVWATMPESWSNVTLDVYVMVLLDEINI